MKTDEENEMTIEGILYMYLCCFVNRTWRCGTATVALDSSTELRRSTYHGIMCALHWTQIRDQVNESVNAIL